MGMLVSWRWAYVKKRMWLFALAAAILLAMLVGFFTLSVERQA
jgi:hypothetical protein